MNGRAATGRRPGAFGAVLREGEKVRYLELFFDLVFVLWWTYFDVVALVTEQRLRRAAPGREQNALARDSYSYLHLPMVAGIILVALGLENILAHVLEPLHTVPAFALLGGVAIYSSRMSRCDFAAHARSIAIDSCSRSHSSRSCPQPMRYPRS